LAVQVRVPPLPHSCVAPGAHTPSSVQAPQSDHWPVLVLHVRVCAPQFPHACTDGPLQVWLAQVPHWQAAVQVCMPPLPHACMAPGAQAPSLAQPDQLDHTPFSQVRVWLPQLPQLWVLGPAQLWPMQTDHMQRLLHVCMPFVPHDWTAPGVQPVGEQVPTIPGSMQLSQVPPQGRSQQTPIEQLSPLWQSPSS
jgi:hypothetical protein